MHTIDGLNNVIQYIEDHLTKQIDYEEMAKLYAGSKDVLQKTFLNICNVTISEYIRKRRLSEAVFDLRKHMKVIDVALKYQYESEDAFTRAFKRLMGITPSKARDDESTLVMYSRIVFTLTIQGTQAMNYRMEHRGSMRIIGYRTFIAEEQIGTDFIPTLWDNFSEQKSTILNKKCNHAIEGIIGVNGKMHDGGFDYWIGVTSDEEGIDDYGEFIIPESNWLKIIAKGALRPTPIALKKAYQRFYKEWLPFSTYEHSGIAEIEYYPNMGSDVFSDEYECELWISIKQKEE